jgi:hypothetical protein
MSYDRMWDPEPPTPAERAEAEIKASGGVIVRKSSPAQPDSPIGVPIFEFTGEPR